MKLTSLEIGNKFFDSRLILGTGKYPSLDTAIKSIESSQTQMVTVCDPAYASYHGYHHGYGGHCKEVKQTTCYNTPKVLIILWIISKPYL